MKFILNYNSYQVYLSGESQYIVVDFMGDLYVAFTWYKNNAQAIIVGRDYVYDLPILESIVNLLKRM